MLLLFSSPPFGRSQGVDVDASDVSGVRTVDLNVALEVGPAAAPPRHGAQRDTLLLAAAHPYALQTATELIRAVAAGHKTSEVCDDAVGACTLAHAHTASEPWVGAVDGGS